MFQRLDDEGITGADTLRFYPYRATFDFECFFDGENLPADSDRVQWIARHVLLSVSLPSNVPGHETPRCFVTDGDSDKLVGAMMSGLSAVSNAACDMLIPSYDNVLNEFEVRNEVWEEAERKALKEAESKQEDDEDVEMEEVKTNPYKTLIGQLFGWLHQLPVIGFNSGKYDLNVIKQFFVPYLLKPSKQDDNDDGNDEEEEYDDDDDETLFVIKRQNTFMCFSTKKLQFLDIINFLAPGYSYDKYMKAYGCELQKGHFPYEYMDGIGKLDDCALPPSTRRTAICTYSSKTISSVVLLSYFTATMRRTSPRYGTNRAIVGHDATALYMWALMQDMPTGWYTRRREKNAFRPQQAQPCGQMAVQWLTWEAVKNGCAIRHQVNGREKQIGKLLVDGWCAKTRTAYQFHGCFFHGCPKCYDENEMNMVNGKTMATLLENTRCNTAYLRRHVKVVKMRECEWKEVRNESDVKTFLAPSMAHLGRWTMTQQQTLAAVVDGTLFVMVECDVRVPEELQDYFSEMQPVFIRYDIGPFMRQYAEEHDILSKPRVLLVGSFRGVKILLATPLLRWYLAHGSVVDRV